MITIVAARFLVCGGAEADQSGELLWRDMCTSIFRVEIRQEGDAIAGRTRRDGGRDHTERVVITAQEDLEGSAGRIILVRAHELTRADDLLDRTRCDEVHRDTERTEIVAIGQIRVGVAVGIEAHAAGLRRAEGCRLRDRDHESDLVRSGRRIRLVHTLGRLAERTERSGIAHAVERGPSIVRDRRV